MTRIIGGLIGSRRLNSPAKSTRPTADRIRESIFSALESKNALSGSKVLDLYAGTGSLALEALSRGAKLAVLVESNKKAAGVCIQNSRLVKDALAKEGHEVDVSVKIQPVLQFLASSNEGFDLVFIDPPYEIPNEEVSKNLEALAKNLNQASWIILERSSKDKPPDINGYELVEIKSFGDTSVYWLKLS